MANSEITSQNGKERKGAAETKPVEQFSFTAGLKRLSERSKTIAIYQSKLARQKMMLLGGTVMDEEKEEEQENVPTTEDFEEIWDYNENAESFAMWKEQYLSGKDENGIPFTELMSLEEFILDKQKNRVESIRVDLVRKRINENIGKIYPEKTKFPQKMSVTTTFFKENKVLLEEWISASGDSELDGDAEIKKKLLLKIFRETVFPDIEFLQIESYMNVERLFDMLMQDYSNMANVNQQLHVLNDEMVTMMSSSEKLSETEWYQKLAEAAEEAADRQPEENLQERTHASVPSDEVAVEDIIKLFDDSLSVGAELNPETKITFEMLEPGKFQINFPESGNVSVSTASFAVTKVDGKERFTFDDPLMDQSYEVGPKEFREMVNRTYLEKIMANLKMGEDYRGPSLNEGILPDQEMLTLAQNLFAPSDLAEKPITKEQAEVFGKLLEIVVGKANNQLGSGDYGDLLPVKRRIQLMQMALEINGKGTQCFDLLKDPSIDVSDMSVESLCKRIGINPNSGLY
jgi:hypothetical protein